MGAIQAGLAMIGIGGFYLFRTYREGNKQTTIEGPYHIQYDPYEPTHSITSKIEYHLITPKGAVKNLSMKFRL